MRDLKLIPGPVTKQIFNKPSVTYKPSDIWKIFDHLSNGGSLDQAQTEELFDFFLSIGIQVIAQKYPHDPVKYKAGEGFIANGHQVDELMEIVLKLHDYFVEKPQRVIAQEYFPTEPSTIGDERRFHSHFKSKGGNLWTDGYRKRKNDPLRRRIGEANDFYEDSEHADERRAAVHTEAMTEELDFFMTKSASSYSLNLQKACSSEDMYKKLTTKAKDTINSIYFSQHYKQFIKDSTTDPKVNKYKPLVSLLSENKIELDTIFSFLNPESQKEKQDYSYITQGAISAITTAIMSSFKKDGDSLHITLTNGESSLNTDKLAETSASFLKEMIEKDFAVKRGEVSSLAKSVVAKVVNEIDVPFSIPIPSDSEYESFKSMIEMNGPIKVKVPFANQGDRPFWDEENVLDDKMVQLLEASIKEAINKADIGKAILKCL